MTQINQSSLADPEVPRGGTIRDTITWDGNSGVEPTHNFYLLSIYGIGTTPVDILLTMLAGTYTTISVTGAESSLVTNIDTSIPTDAVLGTYSCLTVITDEGGYNTETGEITYSYDSKIDPDVLTVVMGIGATIISTSFARV